MGFFKKFKRFALPAIGAVLGSTILPGVGYSLGALGSGTIGALGGGAIGAGVGGAVSSYTTNHNILDALKAGAVTGAGAYAGGQLGNYAGNAMGDTVVGRGLQSSIGDTLASAGSTIDPYLAQTASNALPASIGGASIGSTLGSAYGVQQAQNAFPDAPKDAGLGMAGPAPFQPKQQAEQDTPASLQGLGSLTDEQKSTNLANQGVYGSGNGPQEQSYFMNLLNRRLVDQGGKTSELSKLNPIEQSYLSKLGLSGYGNTNSLLEAMSKWSPA